MTASLDAPPFPNALVRDAAARAGLVIRAATPADEPAVHAVAGASFRGGPGELSVPAGLAQLLDADEQDPRYGPLVLGVAESAQGIVGFACWQLRANGDLYLVQLAAVPPAPIARRPGAATLLLATALAHGLHAGLAGAATVNVLPPMRGARDAATFYERFGYAVCVDTGRGYRALGVSRPSSHRWMAARPEEALALTMQHLTA
jgi:predicted N-acetyltransferase YhbS